MKKYKFRFTAQQAEFNGTLVSIIYEPGCRLLEEVLVCTLPEANECLHTFTAKVRGPSVCTVTCMDSPVPPGYRKMVRTLFKREVV